MCCFSRRPPLFVLGHTFSLTKIPVWFTPVSPAPWSVCRDTDGDGPGGVLCRCCSLPWRNFMMCECNVGPPSHVLVICVHVCKRGLAQRDLVQRDAAWPCRHPGTWAGIPAGDPGNPLPCPLCSWFEAWWKDRGRAGLQESAWNLETTLAAAGESRLPLLLERNSRFSCGPPSPGSSAPTDKCAKLYTRLLAARPSHPSLKVEVFPLV